MGRATAIIRLNIVAEKNAIERLVSGPANATHIMSRNGFLKCLGLTGTGLAQPIMNPVPERINRVGKMMDPNGSTCGSGFRVRRPRFLAVGSPKAFATYPWETS